VVRDVREQNLVDDHHPHDQPHQAAEGEDEANWRRVFPICALMRDELGARHHHHIGGQRGAQARDHGRDIRPGPHLERGEVDDRGGAVAHDAAEIRLRQHGIAIRAEACPDADQARELHHAAAELHVERPLRIEHRGRGAEFGAGAAVEGDGVGALQRIGHRFDPVEAQRAGVAVEAHQLDGPARAIGGIPPGGLGQVDRHRLDHVRVGQRLVGAAAGEAFGAEARGRQRVHQEDVGAHAAQQRGGTFEQGGAKAELHEDEHAGEHHARHGGEEPRPLRAQLPPGEAQRQVEHRA